MIQIQSYYLGFALHTHPDARVQSLMVTVPVGSKVLQITNDSDGVKLWVEFDPLEIEETSIPLWMAKEEHSSSLPSSLPIAYVGSLHEVEESYDTLVFNHYWHVYTDRLFTR